MACLIIYLLIALDVVLLVWGQMTYPPVIPTFPPPPTNTPVVNESVMVFVGEPVRVGQDVQITMNCVELIGQVNDGTDVSVNIVNWYKNGREITNGSELNVLLSTDKRLCIITDTLLSIGGQPGTDGNYTCEVCTNSTMMSCIMNSTIAYHCEPPYIAPAVGDPVVFPGFIALTCGQDATVETLAGTTASLSCSILNGSDAFTMEVYKDSVLVSNNFALDIAPASDDDFGTYTFRVLNDCGQDIAVSRILLQGVPPDIDEGPFIPLPDSITPADVTVKIGSPVYVIDGSDVIINCNILTGTPPITIIWLRNRVLDSSLSSANSVTINDYMNGDEFTCRSDNNIGYDKEISIINVFASVEAPTNVRATVLTPRSVEITWDLSSSPTVTGYLITYTTSASYTSGGKVTVNGHDTTSHTLTNLEENTPYTITVQTTIDNNSMSTYSNKVLATTYTDVPSSSPQYVMVASVNPASLMVSWQPPPEIDWNGLIYYMIQYVRVGSSDMLSENTNSGTTHTISGLVPYVNYSVIVVAINGNGTGPFSNTVVGRSGEDVPSKPHTLEIFTINSSSVTLQWSPPDPPNGVITQYSIQLNGTDIDVLSSNMLMYTIGGLSPDTMYVFQLTAHTTVGAGPPSTITIVTSAGSISAVTVSVGSVTSSALTLTWMEINLTNSKLSHYTLFYLPLRGPYGSIMASDRRKRRQSVQAGELTMNFTETIGTLNNLYGAVTYRIQVAAVSTFNGQYITGDRSPAIEITTLEGVPSIPRNFVVNPTDTGVMFNITLTWSRPDPPNGIITQYIVFYIGTNSRGENIYDLIIQTADINSNVDSSHTWTNLIQGRYQFSVVASSSSGSGEAASLMLDNLPLVEASSDSNSDDNAGVIIALAILFAIAVIGLVISVAINVFFVVQHKQHRYDINESNIRYSEVKQSVSRDNTITDSKYVQSAEPEYEAIFDPKLNMKPDCDVNMDANPAYHATS